MRRLGRLHSAACVLYSLDFESIEKLQRQKRWKQLYALLLEKARALEAAGAELLVICSNTMHKDADLLAAKIDIPLIHIVDAAAAAVKRRKLQRVGLLGTKYTMGEEFYRQRLSDRHGIEVLIPKRQDCSFINNVIYRELCRGSIINSSRRRFVAIIKELAEAGAQGIILGCTEIPLLLRQADSPLPLFNTTFIHAVAAVDQALGGPGRGKDAETKISYES